MRRYTQVSAFALAIILCTEASADPQDATKAEIKKFQGIWKLVGMQTTSKFVKFNDDDPYGC